MKAILPILVALSALAVSGTAAYYSITGLGSLFAGATEAVIIMATALEFSKLIIASVLYRFWEDLKSFLKVYLSLALFVLVVITSTGIYGFLSAAYQETSSKIGVVDEKVLQLQNRKESVSTRLDLVQSEKGQLIKSMGDLQYGLSNNQISYKDAQGNLITSTSSANRRSIEKQLDALRQREQLLDSQSKILIAELDSISSRELELKTELLESGEVGSLKYIANITGMDLDSVVNYLILMLVVVFDPLALSLVTVFNMITSKKTNPEEKQEVKHSILGFEKKEEEKIEPVDINTEPIKEEVKPVNPVLTKVGPRDILSSDIEKINRKSPEVSELLLKSGEVVKVATQDLIKLKDPKDSTNVIQYL